jgi:hypothetical protein
MIENVIFGFSVTALLAGATFIAHKVKKRSNDLEKAIEAMKPTGIQQEVITTTKGQFSFISSNQISKM